MKLHRKIGSWLVDYGHMIRGTANMIIHRNPPAHYLGYRVAGKVPVILIPGILGKWGFMKKIGDSISLHGHPVYIVRDLGYNIYSIPSSAKTLRSYIVHIIPKRGHIPPKVARGAERVREFMEKEGIRSAVLVAHSKGGLIGKYVLAHHNEDGRVFGMVSIATPFSGSAMAKLIPHDSFRELKNDSEVIRDMEMHMEVNKRIISIIPEYDNHVWADRGSFLPGAENVEVSVHGHHKVLFSPVVMREVLHAVERLTLRVQKNT